MQFDEMPTAKDVRLMPVHFVKLYDHPEVYGYSYLGEVFINRGSRRGSVFLQLTDR